MNQQAPTIADVLNFVNSFHDQCRNIVFDAVRALRDEHQIYLTHSKPWDYAEKPNDRFLDQAFSCVRRTWSTFVSSGEVPRGAVFHFEFFQPHRRVVPALVYGSVDPGRAGFAAADRFAPYYTTTDAEKGDQTVTVRHEGPIAVVRGAMPKHFEEAALVRVPLETIADHVALQNVIVRPLAALLRGDQSAAARCLAGAATELWPSREAAKMEEDEDEPERS